MTPLISKLYGNKQDQSAFGPFLQENREHNGYSQPEHQQKRTIKYARHVSSLFSGMAFVKTVTFPALPVGGHFEKIRFRCPTFPSRSLIRMLRYQQFRCEFSGKRFSRSYLFTLHLNIFKRFGFHLMRAYYILARWE